MGSLQIRKWGAALVCAGAAGLQGPALAQTQTLEGAQEFMRLSFAQGGVKFAVDLGSGFSSVPMQFQWVGAGVQRGTWSVPPYSNATYNPQPNKCLARIEGVKPSLQLTLSQWTPSQGRRTIWLTDLPYGPYYLDYAKVTKVTQSGSTVTANGGLNIQLIYTSDQIATRVAYAMEFARQKCDPAAATGF